MNDDQRPAALAFDGVEFAYGAAPAVRQVSLAVQPGELVVLVGPSGCGKSTLLRLAAGLLAPAAGTITLDGRDLRGLPPERRRMGWVPQSYALFEHLSVAENIAFGPRMQGAGRAELRARVDAMLTLCEIAALAARPVRALSGGQRQRVAIARALAAQPRVLLLDEPLAALDPQLRYELRGRLVELLRASGVTTLFVTHDQAEALAVADRIAVLRGGAVEQFATPEQLWESPRNAFVARFLSGAELVEARPAGDMLELAPGLRVPGRQLAPPGQTAIVALRPSDLQWGTPGAPASVIGVEYVGGGYRLSLRLEGGLRLACNSDEPLRLGAVGSVGLRAGARPVVVAE